MGTLGLTAGLFLGGQPDVPQRTLFLRKSLKKKNHQKYTFEIFQVPPYLVLFLQGSPLASPPVPMLVTTSHLEGSGRPGRGPRTP